MEKELNEGFKFRCPYCGDEMIWDSCESSIEVRSDISEEDQSVISYYSCKNCGCDIEVYECPDEYKKEYPYWKDR